MELTLTATVTSTETKKVRDYYVTDIIVERQVGDRIQPNLLKYYHNDPDHGLYYVHRTYKFFLYLNGRKVMKQDGTELIINELKIKNHQEL